MRIRRVCSLLGCLAAVLIFPYYLQGAELVSHWSFNEGTGAMAHDRVGGHHGIIYGAEWTEGKVGRALEFDGEKSHVRVQHTDDFNLDEVSITAWIYPRRYPAGTPIYWAGIAGKRYHSESTYGLRLSSGRRLHFRSYGSDGSTFDCRGESIIELHRWHHAAVTYDGSHVRIYLNGRLDAVHENSGNLHVNNFDFFIGAVSDRETRERGFSGIIDEVKLYAGALTHDEVMRDFQESSEGAEVYVASIPRIKNPPRMDGRLDDGCWDEAVKVRLSRNSDGGKPMADTFGYLAYDDENLYIGFRCEEPFMNRIRAEVTERGGPVWNDDCVEIFIDNNMDRRSYYYFGLNAIGTRVEKKYLTSLREVEGWETEWEVAAYKGEDYWSAEVAIPFSGIAMSPGSGDGWGINLTRHRKPEGGREYMAWSPTGGPFHRPERFGLARGIDIDYPFYSISIGKPSLSRFVDGNRISLRFSQELVNISGKPRDLEVRVRNLQADEEFVERFTLANSMDRVLSMPAAVSETESDHLFQIKVRDADAGRKIHQSTFTASMPRLLQAFFDRDYYTSEESAGLVCLLDFEDGVPAGLKAAVTLRDADRNALMREDVGIDGNRARIGLDISEIPAGDYEGIVNLFSGGELIYTASAPLRKLPGARYEIKADREKLVSLVNETPFFPIGMMELPQDKMAEYAAAGFNIVSMEGVNALDTAFYNNMMTLASTYQHSAPRDFFSTKPLDELEEVIRRGTLIPKIKLHRDHPAFFGYWWDEPGPAEAEGVGVEYRITKEYDPYHAVYALFWQEHGPPIPPDRYDILGHDPYWYPGRNEKVSRTGEMVANHWRAAREIRKPLWIMPQSYGFGPESYLTDAQQRCQTYLHLINEARGILYWNYRLTPPPMEETLKELAGELRELSPVLLTKSPRQNISGVRETGIAMLLKIHENNTYLIAANTEESKRQSVRIKTGGMRGRGNAEVLFEERSIPVREGVFTDVFDPYATRVYKIRGTPSASGGVIDVSIELLSSETAETEKPLIGTFKNHWLERNLFGIPLYWQTPGSPNWQNPEYISVVEDQTYAGREAVRMYTFPSTLFCAEKGYGWVDFNNLSAIDLYSDNNLLRDGIRVTEGVFGVNIPDGRYTVSAVMRSPGEVYERVGGRRVRLSPEVIEIPEMLENFPDFEYRLREYAFTAESSGGRMELEISSGTVFAMEIKNPQNQTVVRRFDFGSEDTPTRDGYIKILASRFTPTVWVTEPVLQVSPDTGYRLSVDIRADSPGRTVGVRVHDRSWRAQFPVHVKTFELDEGWKTYNFDFKVPPGQAGRLRVIFNVDSREGSIYLGRIGLEDRS